MKLLQHILDTLPNSQRTSLKATLVELERAGLVERPGLKQKRRELLASIEKDREGPTFVPVLSMPFQPLSSGAWNDMQEGLYSDLVVLYDQISRLGTKISDQNQLTHSNFVATKVVIRKIIEQVRVYQFLRAHPEYQDVRFLSFLDGRNLTVRRPSCVVDPDIFKVELPTRIRRRLQQGNIDLRTTQVSTTVVGDGLAGGFSAEFSPDKMLDADPDTFWGELVLADAVVRQDYSASWGNYRAQGVVGEVEIDLNRAERVNNVRLLPFGTFPVRVVDLAYKHTPSEDGWQTVPGFAPTEPTLDFIEFDFSPVPIGVLRVSIEQPNYARHIYHLPANVVHNTVLWEQVLDQEYDQILHQVQLDEAMENEVDASPEKLASFNALDMVGGEMERQDFALSRSSQLAVESDLLQDIGRVMTKTDPERLTDVKEPVEGVPAEGNEDLVEVSKYEYTFGIRTVEVNRVLYAPSAHYSSPKLSPGATVLEVVTATTEEHVEFEDETSDFRRSSIEYEIEIGENRTFPILPDQEGGLVKDEYIVVDRRTRKGATRLPVASVSALVRKNGVRMKFNEYLFYAFSGASGDVGILEITEAAYDANAVYTVRYQAHASATTLSLTGIDSTALLEPEVFEKTDRDNRIQLSYYPYVEYDVVGDTGVNWEKIEDEEAKWRFLPASANINGVDGSTVQLTQDSATVTANGALTFDGLTGLDDVFFQVPGQSKVYAVTTVASSTLTLSEVYVEDTDTGSNFEIGRGLSVDGMTFALDQTIYEPLSIFVNDQKAVNITGYEDFEHPAFLPGEPGRRYQYIHAGRNVYFNTPISDAKIEVYYRWRTQYLRLNARMRSNFPIFTEVTPKLVDATLKLKTTRL